jgi:predicted RNase H-like HicB family nuclease
MSSSQDYLIVIHPAEEGGFWTEVPDLPGCGSQGETLDEAVEMTKDAIGGFLESLRKHGEAPPTEKAIAVKVTVAA